jgi:hypothetical protein
MRYSLTNVAAAWGALTCMAFLGTPLTESAGTTLQHNSVNRYFLDNQVRVIQRV